MDNKLVLTLVVSAVLAVVIIIARINEKHAKPRHTFYVDYAEITRRCSGKIITVTVVYMALVVIVTLLVIR